MQATREVVRLTAVLFTATLKLWNACYPHQSSAVLFFLLFAAIYFCRHHTGIFTVVFQPLSVHVLQITFTRVTGERVLELHCEA